MKRLFFCFSFILSLVVVSFVLAAGLADWPTTGTISTSKMVLDPQEKFQITITGQDKDGLYDLWIQVQGPDGNSKLYQFEVQGRKRALKKLNLSLSPGDYRISGSVRGYKPDGYITSVTTSPPFINVWVRPYATHSRRSHHR